MKLLEQLDLDDVMLGGGATLVTIGLWPWLHQCALVVPGCLMIWLALPTRTSFIAKPPTDDPTKSKR